MKGKLLAAIGATLVLLTAGFAGCSLADSGVNAIYSDQDIGIWVSGSGSVMATPDIATLNLGVEAEAKTVAEASAQAATAIDAVMTALAAQGIADEDIQTQYFNINTIRAWIDDEYEIVGYRVTNSVTAKIRDVETSGAVIDAVVDAGGNYTRINGLSFSIDDPSAYYEQVRAEAMADAIAKAEQLAELGGVTLGDPVYIIEGSISGGYKYVNGSDAVESPGSVPSTSVSAGELEIQLTVQVVFNIK